MEKLSQRVVSPFSGESGFQGEDRRLFVLLSAGSLLAVAFLLFLIVSVLVVARGSSALFSAVMILAIPALFFLGSFAMLLILSGFFSRDVRIKLGKIRISINELFPLMKVLGKCLGKSNEEIEKSFIDIHNRMLRRRKEVHAPSELLLLLPRCLQYLGCPEKVVLDYKNCKACGNCEIGSIIALCDSKGVKLSIATGGEIARQVVREARPHAIVAVACERELASGIRDTASIPSYVIINERPEGPCRNTRVNLKMLEEAVSLLIRE